MCNLVTIKSKRFINNRSVHIRSPKQELRIQFLEITNISLVRVKTMYQVNEKQTRKKITYRRPKLNVSIILNMATNSFWNGRIENVHFVDWFERMLSSETCDVLN